MSGAASATRTLLEEVRAQESALRFAAIDRAQLFDLGTALRRLALHEPKGLAIEIAVEGFVVFRHFMEGTGLLNEYWMRKKQNTVRRTGGSSLRAALEHECGELPPGDWAGDEANYALCGGGFPLLLRDGTMAGSVCVSGLPHLDDHRIVVEGLRAVLREGGASP